MANHTAILRYLRIAPRKVRLVADLVKGLPVNEAEARLMLAPQRAAKPILKLLRSAVVGAKQNELNVEQLYIAALRVDQGPMLKRYMMRARGGASQIQKKMSHVTLALAENPNQKPGRFTIVVEKKAKKEDEPKKRRPKKQVEDKAPDAKPKKGFFGRTFSRKSEGGE